MRIRILAMMLFASFLSQACIPSWNDIHYEGKLVSGQFPETGNFVSNSLFQIRVLAIDKRDHRVEFVQLDGQNLLEFTIRNLENKGFDLEIPFLRRKFKLKELTDPIKPFGSSKCYAHTSDYSISTCLGSYDFYFIIKDRDGNTILETLGGVFERQKFEYESPRSVLLSEALLYSAKKNFKSLIEFEHMLQAWKISEAANLNLLPHFRYSDLPGLIFMAGPPILQSFGDWFPFLFPNRWVIAHKAESEARASEISFAIMQANLAEGVQNLSYAYIYDKNRFKIYNEIKSALLEGHQKTLALHERGLIDAHSLGSLKALAETLDITINIGAAILGNDRAATSEALGFLNPNAVTEVVDDDPNPNIEAGEKLDARPIIQTAFSISLERRQLFHLKKAIESKKLEMGFNWMDPTGNPQTALGLNLVPQLQSIDSELRVLALQEDKLEQQINQTAEALVRQHNGALIGFQEALEAHGLYQDRLLHLWNQIDQDSMSVENRIHIELCLSELEQVYKNLLQLKLIMEDYKEKWDRSYARLQRMTLVKVYKQILEPKP